MKFNKIMAIFINLNSNKAKSFCLNFLFTPFRLVIDITETSNF